MRCRSQRNQRESPLLRLPAELRNAIYKCAYSGAVFRIPSEKEPSYLRHCHHLGLCLRHFPGALLLICHQLHAEAECLLYQYSRFSFGSSPMTAAKFVSKRTPEQLSLMTAMEFSVQWCYVPDLDNYDLAAEIKTWPRHTGVCFLTE
jgi:hypothetical protein